MTLTTASAREPLRDRIAALFAGLAVLCAVLLWPLMGNLAAYIALFLFLPAVLIGFRPSDLCRLMKSSWVWLLWAGFALLSCTFLFQPGRASLSSIGDFAVFAVAPAIGLAVAPLGRAWLTLDRFAVLCLAAAVLAGLVGAYGLTLGMRRVTAPNLSPIHFADLAVILGFMGMGVTLVFRSRWRWLALAGPVLGLAASVAAGTRSAVVVGCALAALYAVFFIQQRAMPLWQKLVLPAVLMALVVAIFYLAHLAGYTRAFDALHAIWGTITGDLSGDASTANRIEMFRAGWLAFLDRPLVGHGWHLQLQAAMPYLSEAAQRVYARQEWGYIHNEPLSLAVAAGIPGVIAYCLLIAAPFAALAGQPSGPGRSLATFLAATFVAGLMISGMTDVLFMVELPKLLLVLVAACMFWLKGAREHAANG
jgi:O-antigen ligase